MPNQDDVCIGVFVCRQPVTQISRGQVECFVRLVPRIDLRVDRMGSRKFLFESHVDVKRERVERGLASDEAVDVDDQKSAFHALVALDV